MMKIDNPEAYWATLASVLGLPGPMPSALASRVRSGTNLSFEIVFAMGVRPDPKKKRRRSVKELDQLVSMARTRIKEITALEAKRNLKKQPVIYVDVRPEDAPIETMVKDAVRVPRERLERSIAEVATDPRQPILVYDQDGRFSPLAAEALVEMGYRNVWSLVGGLDGWVEVGMPTA